MTQIMTHSPFSKILSKNVENIFPNETLRLYCVARTIVYYKKKLFVLINSTTNIVNQLDKCLK